MRFLYSFGLGCLMFFSSYNSIRPMDMLNGLNGLGGVIMGFVNKGADEVAKKLPDIIRSIPSNTKKEILNKCLFSSENQDEDIWYKQDGSNICVIAFHGLGGNTTEFQDLGLKIAEVFGCDCVGIGYNSLLDVGDICRSVKTLFEKVRKIVNDNNDKYKQYILFGYSLGVNIAALIGQLMKHENILFDFIGYKGYSSVENCLKNFLKADFIKGAIISCFKNNMLLEGAINNLKINNDHLKGINIDLLLESKAAMEFKTITNNVANIGSLKNEKSALALLGNKDGIKEGHDWTPADIDPIKVKYDEIKDDGNQVIILVVADKDSVVGSGMLDVFNTINDIKFKPPGELPIFNNPPGPQPNPDDEDGANNCDDCCKDCCPS